MREIESVTRSATTVVHCTPSFKAKRSPKCLSHSDILVTNLPQYHMCIVLHCTSILTSAFARVLLQPLILALRPSTLSVMSASSWLTWAHYVPKWSTDAILVTPSHGGSFSRPFGLTPVWISTPPLTSYSYHCIHFIVHWHHREWIIPNLYPYTPNQSRQYKCMEKICITFLHLFKVLQ